MQNIYIKVETSVLKSTAGEVQSLTRTLQEDFDSLQTQVRQTSRYWIGLAGDQYRQEFDAQKQETSEILNILNKYPEDLLTMAGIYDTSEQVNVESASALPSDIIF